MIDVDKIKNLTPPEPTPAPQAMPEESTFDKILSGAKSGAKDLEETAATGGAKLLSGLSYGALKNVGPATDAAKDKAMESLGLKTKSGKDLGQMYDEYKKAYEEMHAKSPFTGQLAEMTGATLSPINKIAAPVGAAVKGTGALANMGRNALVGSTVGATAGIGGTEAQPTLGGTLEEAGKNALAGAGVGALVGGGATAAGELVNATGRGIGHALNWTEPGQKIMAAYRHGLEGGSLLGTRAGANEVQAKATGNAQDLQKRIAEGGKAVSNSYNQILPNNQFEPIASPDISSRQDAGNLIGELTNVRNTGDLQLGLKKFMNGQATPRELKDLQVAIGKQYPAQENKATRDLYSKAVSSIDNELDKIPGYSQVNQFHADLNQIPEGLITGNPKLTRNEVNMSNMRTPIKKTFEAGENVIENSAQPGMDQAGQNARKQLTQFTGRMNDFQKSLSNLSDEEAAKLGIDKQAISSQLNPNDILPGMKENAKLYQASKSAMNKPWTPTGAGSWAGSALGKFNSPEATMAPQFRGSLPPNDLKGPADLGQRMYNASAQSLHTAADTLKGNNGTKYLGGALKDALNENNNPARTAALFSIAQSPQARELLKGNNEDEVQPWKTNY